MLHTELPPENCKIAITLLLQVSTVNEDVLCISIEHILEKLLRVKGLGESCKPRCTLRRRPQMRWSIWLTQPVISVGGVNTLICHISENTNR